MNRFRFYHISEKYINFLHSIDHRVQLNKGERRPAPAAYKSASR